MPQMVLPQTPAPGMQQDSGSLRAGSSRGSGDSERRFESVSRAEHQRLEQQRTRQRDEAHAEDQRNADQAAESPSPDDVREMAEQQEASAAGEDTAVAVKDTNPDLPDAVQESDPVVLPLTFTELQALVMPAAGQDGQTAAQTAVASGATGSRSQTDLAGIVDGVISNGSKGAQTTPGTTPASLLTDALSAQQASDAGRTPDTGNLALASRFDSVMANASAGAQRVATEAAIPLRAYATSIDVPVGHGEWGDRVVGKLSWLTARNMSVAEIHLTPPDMGPMEVKVRVHNDQANITVHAANPMVRDQLELHSHRLRDMLGEQGLSLAQFDVSDSPRQQTGEQAGEGGGSGSGQGRDGNLPASGSDEAVLVSGSLDLSWKGEVDLFA